MPSTSRAWFVDRYGGPERLELRTRPDPVPGAGEVLVRTAAIGLNFADLFVRAGVYPRTPKPPFVPGMEISGTVEGVGEGVDKLSPGQRVVAVPLFGGHAEKVLVPAARLFPLPDDVDPSRLPPCRSLFSRPGTRASGRRWRRASGSS